METARDVLALDTPDVGIVPLIREALSDDMTPRR